MDKKYGNAKNLIELLDENCDLRAENILLADQLAEARARIAALLVERSELRRAFIRQSMRDRDRAAR